MTIMYTHSIEILSKMNLTDLHIILLSDLQIQHIEQKFVGSVFKI